MCKRNSPEKKKKETNTGYLRETSQIKKRQKKDVSTGYARQLPA